MTPFLKRLAPHLRRPTLIEGLVVMAIICVAVALLLPPVQWASSGDITVPVRVIVFDAAQGTPISGAQVLVVRSPPTEVPSFMTDLQERVPHRIADYPEDRRSVTDSSGQAIIQYSFRTGAGNQHPIPSAHLSFYWGSVLAPGYGGSVTPVRYESVPTAELRKRGELVVPVGLLREAAVAVPSQ